MGSLTPLNRILNIGDNVKDDLILNVKCDDNTNERDFYYNGITNGDIDAFLCPAFYGQEDQLVSTSADSKTCPDIMASFPSDTYITEHTDALTAGTYSDLY